MPSSVQIPETLENAEAALRRIGKPASDVAWPLLERIGEDKAALISVAALKKGASLEGDQIERILLWHAAQRALAQTPSLSITSSVRTRLEQDLPQLHAISSSFDTYAFDRAAKIATLRRFPAGPMEWEISGIPRSYFLRADFPANARLAAFVLRRLRGLGPCFFMHVAPSPRNRALSIPKEVLRSYFRMVRSLELQPEIRGLLARAWFHDPKAVRDNPHLEVLSRPYLEAGGLITVLEPAPLSSGVFVGNAQRSADYAVGKVHYRYGFAILPRDAAIAWANQHPELAD